MHLSQDISSNTTFLLSALTLGVASLVYIFYGPSISHSKKGNKNGRVSGLLNYGNQCFINAVLQSLASCHSIMVWLKYVIREQENGHHENDGNQKSLSHQVYNTLNLINNSSASESNEASPIDVLNALRAHRWLISNEEQDASELFNVLTSTLECELYSSLPVYSLKDVMLIEQLMLSNSDSDQSTREQGIPSASTCSQASTRTLSHKCRHTSISTRVSNFDLLSSSLHHVNPTPSMPKSLPTKGMLASQLHCRICLYRYPVHLDSFDSVSLVMPTKHVFGTQILLQECLNKFVSNEIITEVTCEGCSALGKKEKASVFSKKLTFAKLPDLLCFHMQRLVWLNNGHAMKRYEHVVFPEYLTMDPYVYKYGLKSAPTASSNITGLIGGASNPIPLKRAVNPNDSFVTALPPPMFLSNLVQDESSDAHVEVVHTGMAKYKYKLASVIVHLGDASSGHFICYRRGADISNQSQWYYCSDNNVMRVPIDEVLHSPAYMLFYERIRLSI